jgi:hypothetical protein
MDDLLGGITAFVVFLGLSIPIIVVGLVYYLKKKLEHKQIIAAIEKGTSLSELRPAKPIGPLWIKNLTAGIALLIVGIGLACMPLLGYFVGPPPFVYFVIALILFSIGISRLIRGLLQRKTKQQIQSSEQNDVSVNKKPDGTPAVLRS